MCYVNMLKGYHVRDGDTKPVLSQNTVTNDTCDESENPGDDFVMDCSGCGIRLENADILSNLEAKVSSAVLFTLIITIYLIVVFLMMIFHVLSVALAL